MGIQRDRLVREFQTLVAFDSESYHERAIADYLKGALEELGAEVSEDDAPSILAREGVIERNPQNAGNLYGYLKGNAPGEPILLSSHMDTVKPGNGKRAILREDGRITSDGTTVLGADDAGGLAAILEALRVLREEELPHPDIEVLFPIAEEPYVQGSRVFDYTRLRARTAFVFDLSGELGRAAVAAPTILSLRIEVKGKSAHAGFCPEEGVHAIAIAAEALANLSNGWISEHTSVNIGMIRGGLQRNIVPELVEIEGEIRSLVHEEALEQERRIREVFSDAARKYGGEVCVEARAEIKAYRTPEDSEAVRRFREACARASLGEARLIETFGGSDNNHYAQHGILGIVVASAMQDVHTTHEYTTAGDLEKVAELALYLASAERR